MIKLALPAGDLRTAVAELLESAGLPIEGYGEGSRNYRLAARGQGRPHHPRLPREGHPRPGRPRQLRPRHLQHRLGQGDARALPRPAHRPAMLISASAQSSVFAAAADARCRLADLGALPVVRIASEYPNLAETFARSARLRRYRVQAVWGAAEAYPPEDADCVLTTVSRTSLRSARTRLRRSTTLLDNSAWLIGNANALAAKDLSAVVGSLTSKPDRTQLRTASACRSPVASSATAQRRATPSATPSASPFPTATSSATSSKRCATPVSPSTATATARPSGARRPASKAST